MARKKLPPLIDVPGRPDFSLINRYMPDASDEEKDEAYENLKHFARVLHHVDERVTLDMDSTAHLRE